MIMYPRNAILFSGGGTMGSVMPLVACAEKVKEQYPHMPFVWFGTMRGIERRFLESRFPYRAIGNGKFRRYFSLRSFIDPFLILGGFFQSLFFFCWNRPRAVVSAGGFVAVPVHWAAYIVGVPSLSLQLDTTCGLAHRVVRFAVRRKVSVFPSSADRSPVAIPIRKDVRAVKLNKSILHDRAVKTFSLRAELPTLFILGGGTGARAMNRVVGAIAQSLLAYCNIVHGIGRHHEELMPARKGYYARSFLDTDLPLAFAAADVVVSRGGMGTLAECAYLRLPCIVVPLPFSAQVKNAEYLASRNGVFMVCQGNALAATLLDVCIHLMTHPEERKRLGERLAEALPTDDGTSMVKQLIEIGCL